jgi:polyphosphate kinase
MPYSKNIQITRIVDRFLEHSRIYAFYNNGNWEVYISSADLLTRNVRRRVETLIPIFDKTIIQELIDILMIQLKDNTKGKILNSETENIDKFRAEQEPEYRAQIDTYKYLAEKYEKQ